MGKDQEQAYEAIVDYNSSLLADEFGVVQSNYEYQMNKQLME